jgi:hypothetical protein
MFPVLAKLPVAGSNSSALARYPPVELYPPAMSTLPFGSGVDVWNARAATMLPVGVNVPAAGSYSSALAT